MHRCSRCPATCSFLVGDFSQCNARLWADKLGQISLATTTLFWGVSGNLRVIVFAWAAAALGYSTTQASSLVGVVAIGTAVGAVVASWLMRLEHATRVIPLGVAMGVLIIGLNVIREPWVAAPFFILLGAIGGFLVVPMNALLQHRGHNLMGAGRSIAVQNFNEQAAILGLGAFYTGMTKFGLSAFVSIAVFGVDGHRHDGVDRALAPLEQACATATRCSACSRSHAPTSSDARPAIARRGSEALCRRSRWCRPWQRCRRCCSTPAPGGCRGGRCGSCRRWGCIRCGRPP